VIDIIVNSPLPDGTILDNYVSITCDQGVSDHDTEDTTVDSDPVLVLSKEDDIDPVGAGGSLTYTLTYKNVGTTTATGTVITDVLPPEVTYNPVNPAIPEPDSISVDGRTLTWNIGALDVDATGTIVIPVQVNAPLPNGTVIENLANITCDQGSQDDSELTTVASSSPALSIVKTADIDPIQPGDTLEYTIVFENTGTQVATNVVITETYDPNVTFLSSTPVPDGGTDNTWTWGPLSPFDGPQTIVVYVTVNSPLVDGTVLENHVSINSDEQISDDDSEQTTVTTPVVPPPPTPPKAVGGEAIQPDKVAITGGIIGMVAALIGLPLLVRRGWSTR
jgi:uncharacterized repeat protein (TIGR01451 family)